MPARNEDVAVLGIVAIFGIEHVEITVTVGNYQLFFDSDTPTQSQASRGLTRELKLDFAHGVVHPHVEIATIAQIPDLRH